VITASALPAHRRTPGESSHAGHGHKRPAFDAVPFQLSRKAVHHVEKISRQVDLTMRCTATSRGRHHRQHGHHSFEEIAAGLLIADNLSTQYGGRVGWRLPHSLKFNTLTLEGGKARIHNGITGTEQNDIRLIGLWTVVLVHRNGAQ
jgi:hypothetical protein